MTNVPLLIHDIHLTPTEAIVEIWPLLGGLAALPVPGQPTAGVEYRGKLVGPRCRYANTIEVAYPLRQTPGMALTLRAVIPEPNFWDPVSPFLYHGTLEAWENGQLTTTVRFTHGLRSFRLGAPGFRLNGKPTTLQAAARSLPFEADLQQLRSAGCNALVIPVEVEGFADSGDELGLLIVRRIHAANVRLEWGENPFTPRTSSLGYLVSQDLLQDAAVVGLLPNTRDALREKETKPPYWGVELERVPAEPLPAGVSFVACSPALLPQLGALALPVLLLESRWPDAAEQATARTATPGVLGWLRSNP